MKRTIIFIALIILSIPLFSQGWMQYLPQKKNEKDLTFYDYQSAFRQWCQEKEIDNTGFYVNSKGVKQKAYGYKQFKRWEIQVEGTYDRVTGRFLREEISKEMDRYYLSKSDISRNLNGNWTNLAYGIEGYGNNGNGRLQCMAFHPTDPQTYWVGTGWGGIWATTNDGQSWTPLSDYLPATSISAIAIPSDYSASQTIYIGSGDRAYYNNRGFGVMKSTNAGITWQNTGLTFESPIETIITRLLIDPANNNTIYAGSNIGIFKSTDAGVSWDTLYQIPIQDMEFHPSNSQIIYAGTRRRYGDPNVRILRSTDAGLNWDTVHQIYNGIRVELAVSPDEPNWVYAVVANNDGGLRGVYRSTNSGASFYLQLNGTIDGNNLLVGCNPTGDGGQGNFDLVISINPQDAENMSVGGVDLYRSDDAGLNFSLLTDGYNRCSGINHNVHVDHHWLEYQPGTNRLFACSDGGIYYSTNNGGSFTNISGGLVINQPYRIGCSQQSYDEIIMGQQDNGTVLWNDNAIDFVGGGDGTDCLINPLDANNQYEANNGNDVIFTLNHWATTHAFNTPGDFNESWFKPIVLLPPDTVFFGGHDLWKSTDKGLNMTRILDLSDTVSLNRIAIAPSNSNIIFLLNNDHLFRTTNGGNSWTILNGTLPFSMDKIITIEIKENDPDVIWICLNDWADGQSIYKSENCGESWSNISEGLPDTPWCDIIQNDLQTNYEELYTCGFFGTYVKLGNNPWIPFNNGLPHVISFDMDIYYDGPNSKIRTGTHGRGVWESDLFSIDNSQPFVWTGLYSTNWHDYRNWNYMAVPSFSTDVILTADCFHYPSIENGDISCRNLTIQQAVRLTITGKKLSVMEDLIIQGQIKFTGQDSQLEVYGDISWEEGSYFDALTSVDNQILVHDDWYFRAGAEDISLDSAIVYFVGDINSSIYSDGDNCGFGDLYINKASPRNVNVASESTSPLFVNGDMTIGSDACFDHTSGMDFNLYGNLHGYGDFFFFNGTLNLKGSNKTIYLANSSSYINNVNCNLSSSAICTLQSDLQVRGDLTLTGGSFNPAGYVLKLRENLIRTSGLLLPGTGRVIFYGNGPQTITGNLSMNTLELAKTADTLFLISNDTVNCNSYYYTSGIMNVAGTANFTANDLLQSGIFGHFILNDNAQINLTKSAGSINLNGIFKITGGNFNVYGGTSTSFWPGNMNSELWVSGGTLDFKDNGIYLNDSYDFLEVITGGAIRTTGSFLSDRNDFTPTGGFIELYGPDNVSLSHGIGGAFWELKINKGVSRAQKVTVFQDLVIDEDLKIYSGTLDINGKTVDVNGSLDINGALYMTDPASVINVDYGVIWYPGSSSNISEGLITFKGAWHFHDGTYAMLVGNNTVKVIGNGNSYIFPNDADACFANFIVEKTGMFTNLSSSSNSPMRVTGNLTVKPGNTFKIDAYDLIVTGTMTAEGTSVVQMQDGGSINANSGAIGGTLNLVAGSSYTGTDLALTGWMNLTDGGHANLTNFTLNGILDINAGYVAVHNSFSQASVGHMIIDGGSFIIDKPYTGASIGFSGITDLNSGLFEISFEGIQFGVGAVVNFNGGNMRIGGHFTATNPNSFQPASGTVELINTIGSTITCNNGNYFHQLIINKTPGSNPCILAAPLTIQDDLILQSGELQTSNKTLTINKDLVIESAGKLSPGYSASVNIGGNWTNNRGTAGFNEGTSTVLFNSAQPATVSSETFFNLDVNKDLASGQYLSMTDGAVINVSNRLTMTDGVLRMSNNSTLSVTGILHLKDGGGLNADPFATGTVINCYGHWWDYNTTSNTGQGFNSGQSTVFFKGSGDQNLIASAGEAFYNLVIQKPGNAVIPFNNVKVLNDFNLISGNWSQNATGLTHVFEGDFTVSNPALWMDQVNTISFEGKQVQNLQNLASGWLNVGALQVNQSDGALSIWSDVNCASKMKVISGGASIADYDLICGDSLVVLGDSWFEFHDDGSVAMDDNASIYINGGNLYTSGCLVTRHGTGSYDFLVDNGGTIQAVYTIFEYMDDRGLDLGGTGVIEGTFPLYKCTFRNGQPSGYFLLLNNNQDVTLYDVDFETNAGSGAVNVAKSHNAGNVYLPGATGVFAGPQYEYDPNNRIHWPSAGIWEGDVSTAWHDPLNWRYDFQTPDAATDVIIPSGKPNYPHFSLQETTIRSLKMEPNTSLKINKDSLMVTTWSDIRGSLEMPVNYTAIFTDSLVWQAGSSANLSDKSTIYISGNMFVKRGSSLNMGEGEFRFYGDGESNLICHDTAQIGSLMNYKNAPYSLNLLGDTLARLTVNGNFENGPGATLKCPSTQEWVFNGNFKNTNNGHFRCSNGSIWLKGFINIPNFRVKPGDYFNNLIIETQGKVNLYTATGYSDTLRVNGDLVINSHSGGTSGITANNFKITLRGDWINNAGTTAFTTGAGQTHQVVFWDPYIRQEIRGNTYFNNIYALNESEDGLHIYDQVTASYLSVTNPVNAHGTLNISTANIDDNLSAIHLWDGCNVQINSLIQGGVIHSHGGELFVSDLSQNYVTGSYIIDGGLVTLSQVQDAGATHDLYFANLTINGGELRFSGGNSMSRWPSLLGGTSNLTMTGGIFWLLNHSVEIRTGNFSENISGGKIIVPYQFVGFPGVTSFHPTGGIVELVEDTDADCGFPEPECWFYDLYINKAGVGVFPSGSLRVKHELKLISGYMQLYGNPVIVGP